MSNSPDDLSFEDAMRQMGVQPLSKKPATPAKRKKPRAEKPRARGTPARAVRGAPDAAAPTRAADASPRRQAAPPPAPVGPDPAVERELDGLRSEVARLRDALEEAHDTQRAAAADTEHAQERLREVEAHRRSLQRALSKTQGEAVEEAPLLTELLVKRGLKGPDEERFLVSALCERRILDRLTRHLEVRDPQSVHELLDDRVVLLGGCEGCPPALGRAVVQVPQSRCEICQGSDIRRSVRRFLDQCLISGLTRVLVVGGSPKYRRQLGELVQHHRVRLDTLSGKARRTQKQANHDLAHNDLVLLWGGTLLDHAVSELYLHRDAAARVVVIPHRGISRMLDHAADHLRSPPAA